MNAPFFEVQYEYSLPRVVSPRGQGGRKRDARAGFWAYDPTYGKAHGVYRPNDRFGWGFLDQQCDLPTIFLN